MAPIFATSLHRVIIIIIVIVIVIVVIIVIIIITILIERHQNMLEILTHYIHSRRCPGLPFR